MLVLYKNKYKITIKSIPIHIKNYMIRISFNNTNRINRKTLISASKCLPCPVIKILVCINYLLAFNVWIGLNNIRYLQSPPLATPFAPKCNSKDLPLIKQ